MNLFRNGENASSIRMRCNLQILHIEVYNLASLANSSSIHRLSPLESSWATFTGSVVVSKLEWKNVMCGWPLFKRGQVSKID